MEHQKEAMNGAADVLSVDSTGNGGDTCSKMAGAIPILRISGAFGIRGLLRAFLLSDRVTSYKKICTKDGDEYSFRLVRFTGGKHVVIALDGVEDRTKALEFKGVTFYINRDSLPSLKSNEYYVHDLIAKKVTIIDHENLDCKIVAVKNFGSEDLIEISLRDDTFFVPFRNEYFPANNSEDQNGLCENILLTSEAFRIYGQLENEVGVKCE